jgi:L-malate glycosyltransferase
MTSSMALTLTCVVPLPPYPAGSAVVCADVLTELAMRGHRVRAIAPIAEGARGNGDDPTRRAPRVPVTRFSVPYFEMFRFTARDGASAEYRACERAGVRDALRSSLEAERPDVVLIGREIYGWYVNDIVSAASLPWVLLSHGGPTTAIRHGAWPPTESQELLAGMAAADVVVSVAEHWRVVLRELGLPRVVCIPNPVDLERFAPGPRDIRLMRRLGVVPDDVVVLHASNLSLVKRVRDVVAAADLALKSDRRLLFVVVGDGPEREHAERLCQELGVMARFRFVGWVEHGAMPDYVRLADVVVVPSEHETQSLVYLEAQASGRCLVASDVPGAAEVVSHEKTGLLFPMGDVTRLADVLVAAARDGARRNAIGLAARASVGTHALPGVTDAYEALLQHVKVARQNQL